MKKQSTIRDVAAHASVSIGTVSNYLNDVKPIAPDTRERIEAAISELEFVPNMAVKVIMGGRSHAIGFVVPDTANPFYTEVARGVEDAAIDAGHVLVSCNTDGNPEREARYIRALSEMRVVGALITPASVHDQSFRALQRSGAQVVMLGVTDADDVSVVAVDDRLGGKLAVAHLIELGHRRIALIGGPAAERQVHDRFAGARDAFVEAGLDPDGLQRIDVKESNFPSRTIVAEEILALDPRPTGLFCANDLIALAVMEGLRRNGIRTPEDIAVVGYDDIANSRYAVVPLTSISVPKHEMGFAAAKFLLEAAAEGAPAVQRVIFNPTLVIRESTAGQGREEDAQVEPAQPPTNSKASS